MKIKRIISMLLACLTLMAVAIPAMAATGDTLYIHSANGNIVNVRSGPGTSYPKTTVGEYSVGTKVFVVDDNSNSSWTQIRDEDYEYGWVRNDLLTSDSSEHDSQDVWERMYGPGTTMGNGGPSTKRQIKAMQEALIRLGYSVGSAGADGYYGTATTSAITRFQQDNGLNANGRAYWATKRLLYLEYQAVVGR